MTVRSGRTAPDHRSSGGQPRGASETSRSGGPGRPRRPPGCSGGPFHTGHLECQAVPDLLLVLREVPPDHDQVEVPQDRLLRLALQQEGETRLYKVHWIRRSRSETSEVGSGHAHAVASLAAAAHCDSAVPAVANDRSGDLYLANAVLLRRRSVAGIGCRGRT